ncbi:amidohydrolase family protein [Streptacidiphilus cavernicola]|uniref:Amidohydrolase n=1 Tax=Streptacidiphilus cavernicola TaxID=3342716 RepID=A0ABV6VWA0_9ACTN
MNLIDAHHHVWDLTVRDQEWITGPELAPIRRSFGLDDLRPLAAAAGVGATIVVQTVCVPEETPELLALAASAPLVAGVVGWTDLTAPGVADALARLRALPGGERLVGIRHQVQGEADPDWLRRPDVLRGLRAVAAAGLVYDLVVLPPQLPAAAYAAAAVPELVFVLDHAGKPPIASGALEPWAGALRALAGRANTVCKLSGLVTEAAPGAGQAEFAPYARVILDAFGPGRTMYGSDWPVCLPTAGYLEVLDLAAALVAGLGLDRAERAAVFAATAARVYLDGGANGGMRGTH